MKSKWGSFMKKNMSQVTALVIIVGLLVFGYTNCGQVSFQDATTDPSQSVGSSSTVDPTATPTTEPPITEPTVIDPPTTEPTVTIEPSPTVTPIVSVTPPVASPTPTLAPGPIPISEIITNPGLIEYFPCPTDAAKIQICHISGGIDGPDICISPSAVQTHMGHTGTLSDGTTFTDYLGLCRY